MKKTDYNYRKELFSLCNIGYIGVKTLENFLLINKICAVIDDWDGLEPLWLMIDSPQNMTQVSESMGVLQEIRDFCGALEKAYEQENGEKPTYEWYQNL